MPLFSCAQFRGINKVILITNTIDIFVIKGNMTHQNNGSIANAGSFYITGNGINDNPSVIYLEQEPMAGYIQMEAGKQSVYR